MERPPFRGVVTSAHVSSLPDLQMERTPISGGTRTVSGRMSRDDGETPLQALPRSSSGYLLDVQAGVSFLLQLTLMTTSEPMRVLLIEDEPHLGSAVQEHVRAAGHAVDWFERLEHAVRTVSYDALLLDLHLPDGRGLDFLRKLRRRGDALPVVILTARDLVSDRIEGLKAGADDYIVKPFDLDEVIARLEAVSRRYFGKAVPVVQVGPVELEWESKVARLDGRPVELSAREWAVIEVLGRRRQSTVSKEQIEDALYAFGEEIESNTIEVYVSRIRRKLGRDFIRTIRGLGYRLGD